LRPLLRKVIILETMKNCPMIGEYYKNMDVKYYILTAIALFFASCNTSSLSIPDTLATRLKSKSQYRHYVHIVNKSIKGDTLALKEIMLIDDLYDGAGYEHGGVLIEILEKVGDEEFNNVITSLDDSKKENVREYIMAGLDLLKQQYKDSIAIQYPVTLKTLQILEKK